MKHIDGFAKNHPGKWRRRTECGRPSSEPFRRDLINLSVRLPPGEGAGMTLGKLLLTKYVLPFEVVSVLLLAALIGAVVIARRDAKTGTNIQPRPIPLPKAAQQKEGATES